MIFISYTGLSFLELTSDTLESFRNSFAKGPKNAFAQNVVARSDPLETCLQRKTLETSNHIYSHKVNIWWKEHLSKT